MATLSPGGPGSGRPSRGRRPSDSSLCTNQAMPASSRHSVTSPKSSASVTSRKGRNSISPSSASTSSTSHTSHQVEPSSYSDRQLGQNTAQPSPPSAAGRPTQIVVLLFLGAARGLLRDRQSLTPETPWPGPPLRGGPGAPRDRGAP